MPTQHSSQQQPKTRLRTGTAHRAGSQRVVTPHGTPSVIPHYDREIDAVLDESDLLTDYYLELLGATRYAIIQVLRSIARRNGRSPESLEERVVLTQTELARRIGHRNRKVITRTFRAPKGGEDYFSLFVRRIPRKELDPRTGRRRNAAHLYIVQMRDPPSPVLDAVLARRQAERILRDGDVLPGDRIPTSQSGASSEANLKHSWPGTMPPLGAVLEANPKQRSKPLVQDVSAYGGTATCQQSTDDCDDDSKHIHELIKALVARGIEPNEAFTLVRQYPAHEIQAQIDYLPYHPGPIHFPGKFLASSIRKRRQPPTAYRTAHHSAPTATRPGLVSAVANRNEAARREARLRARFECLPAEERQAMWTSAEAMVRGEFEQAWANLGYTDRRPPEGAVWAEIYRMLDEGEEGHEGPTSSPLQATAADAGMAPLPSSAFDAGRRFIAWVAEEFGVDPRDPGRALALAAARRRVWVVLNTWGLSSRAIAELCRIHQTAVARGIRLIREDPAELAEALRWGQRFLRVLEVISR